MRRPAYVLGLCSAVVLAVMTAAAPAQQRVWRFAVWNEVRDPTAPATASGIDEPFVARLVADALTQRVEAVFVTGNFLHQQRDGSDRSPEQQYAAWNRLPAPLTGAHVAVYTLRGSHETYQDASGKAYREHIGRLHPQNGPSGERGLTYRVDWRNALFLALDTEVQPHRVNQPWLDDQLAGVTQQHVFVFAGEPAFRAQGYTSLGIDPVARDAFWDALGEAGVNVFFCGGGRFFNRGEADDRMGRTVQQVIAGRSTNVPDDWNDAYPEAERIRRVDHEAARPGYVLATVMGQVVEFTFRSPLENGEWSSTHTFRVETKTPGH